MVKTVAIHEFLFTIKRKAFYIVTLGMPVIVLAYGALIGVIAYFSSSSEIRQLGKPVGIVDRSGILAGPGGVLHDLAEGEVYEYARQDSLELPEGLADLQIPLGRHRLQPFDNLTDAQAALHERQVRSVVVIPEDYLHSGQLEHYMTQRPLMSPTQHVGFLGDLLNDAILKRYDMPDDVVRRLETKPRVSEYELDAGGRFVPVEMWSKGFSMGIPLAAGGLLILALIMNGSLLLASVAEEKENKVMEVILSSVPSQQLLFGKVLGLVAAGLLQITIWLAMVGVVPILTMLILKRQFDYDLNVLHLLLGAMFIVLGFVFYGCLLAGLGSMGSNYKDCQQLTVAIILCACVPMMTWMNFMNDPNGPVARVLSWIPLFSPGSMMLRLGMGPVPWWEVAGSLVVLVGSIWVAVRLSARLFRVGTLMYGKKPGPREIIKALRQPL